MSDTAPRADPGTAPGIQPGAADLDPVPASGAAADAAPCAGEPSPCGDILAALDVLGEALAQTRALAHECRRVARHPEPDARMQAVAEALCRAMRRMAVLEEELFFPAARAALAGSPVVDLAALEHATARQIIARMQQTDPLSPCYEALALALVDCVERHGHHERSELLPRLRGAPLDLAALGAAMRARCGELEADLPGVAAPASPLAGGVAGAPAGTAVA